MSIPTVSDAEMLVATILKNAGIEGFTATTQMESGSNCSKSVVLTQEKSEWSEGGIIDAGNIAQVVFGTGTPCVTMSRKWHSIQRDLQLPETFSWETAILVAAAQLWTSSCLRQPEYLLNAWAYIMAAPREAIMGPKSMRYGEDLGHE